MYLSKSHNTNYVKFNGKIQYNVYVCIYVTVDLPRDGLKSYVDPTNYSNVEEAVLEFANELDPNLIFLERMIGGGEFSF